MTSQQTQLQVRTVAAAPGWETARETSGPDGTSTRA